MFHKRLLREFKENQKYVAGMVAVQWISLLANLILTGTTVWYLTSIYQGEPDKYDLLKYLIVFFSVLTVRGIMLILEGTMSHRASASVKRKLRSDIYTKLMQPGFHYRNVISTSEAVQISTEGVEQLEIYFGRYMPQLFYSLLAPLTLFAVVGSMSLKVAAVLLLCVPLIPLSIVAIQKFARKMLHKYWGSYTELGDTFLEGLQGLTTLKVYQADERYARKMDEEAEKFRKVTMRVLIMQLNSISIMDLVAYGGAAVGIILSILSYRAGNLLLGECIFIMLVSAEFFLPLRKLGSFFHIAMNGNAAADKIFKLLDSSQPREGSGTFPESADTSIMFSRVSFQYQEDKEVLKDISFTIPRNTFVAIAGVSGCGKSTIASLLMGEQKEYQGDILFGNKDSKELKLTSLYSGITRVKHDSYLFRGTVEENLRMGNPGAEIDEMEKALKQVDLYETLQGKGGLAMELTENAANLSGGQRQRLALARAVLHNSDIYIFDEATSNVDSESENKIMEVIEQLAQTKTIILISHRLANVQRADHILFLQDGKIKEAGNHMQLLEHQGPYYKLFEAQRMLEQYGKEAV